MADLARLYNFVAGTVIDSEQVDAEFDQLIARINALEPDSLNAVLADIVGASQTGTVRRGKSIIAAQESRTNTVYGLMTTPDRVQNVVVPADALVVVGYQALWQQSVSGAASAAIFVGANQLQRTGSADNGPTVYPRVQETQLGTPTAVGVWQPLHAFHAGLTSPAIAGGTAVQTNDDVTTGQVLGSTAGGGLCIIDNLAAGTYDISVQFKASSGSVTVKNRRLRVWIIGF